MRFIPKFFITSNNSQLIYAIVVIIIVPIAIATNTLFLLNAQKRDMDFELTNKALLVETVLSRGLEEKINTNSDVQSYVRDIIKDLPEIKAIEVFRPNQNDFSSLATTSPLTQLVSDSILNHLAWDTNQTLSKEIFAAVGQGKPERIWLVVSVVHDATGNKIAVVNLYLSASEIDLMSNRTTQDSFIILAVTMFVIMLLLLNHFRFFEISLLYKKLNEVDKLKDDFISVASHELRTPLTAIHGYTLLILNDPLVKINDKLQRQVNILLESTTRLMVLVENLLDVSRIEEKRVKFDLGVSDIRDIIQNVISDFKIQFQEKHLSLIYTPYQNPLPVLCDKNKMIEIFSNLISNALKYTPEGSVTIYTEIEKNNIKVFVRDTGVGISEEDRQKLFSKFSRLYNEKTKDVYGTGLGLWITKQLVEKMGGKISVESIQNQGSQFIVIFPLRKGISST